MKNSLSQPPFYVFIPIKDISTPYFMHVLRYVERFIRPESIVIATALANAKQSPIFASIQAIGCVKWVDENSVLDGLNMETLKTKMREIQPESLARAGWYLQQFLKMAFASYILKNPATMGGGGEIAHYLIWDADTIPLRKLKVFSHGKVIFERVNAYHKPYFDTLDRMCILTKTGQKVQKECDFSFVSENMMVECIKMHELIELIESQHKKPFWEAILENIEPKEFAHAGFSEYETYGNFVAMEYPQSFTIIQRKRDRYAREMIGSNPSETMLKWYARSYEVLGIESWDPEIERLIGLLQKPWARIFPPRAYRYAMKIYPKLKQAGKFFRWNAKKL